MIQDILTYLTIAAAILWIILKMIHVIRPKIEADCSSGCSGCELKNEIKKKKD